MPATSRSPVLIRHALTLALGATLAVAIWLLGHPELGWLGFASAALFRETPGRCRARARPSRRSP